MTPQCLLVKADTVNMATGAAEPTYISAGAGTHTYDGKRWTDAQLSNALVAVEHQTDSFETGLGSRVLPVVSGLTLHIDRGEQDLIVKRAWDGRPITVYRGPVGASFASFTPIVVATTDQPTFDSGNITVPMRDHSRHFDRPVLTAKYAGTGGLEGPADLTDVKKPRLVGYARQFEPVLIDPALMIYQVSDGGFDALDFGVEERGKAFTTVATSNVLTWAPVSGSVGFHSAGGYFRLGSKDQGVITAHARIGLYDTHGAATVWILQQLLDFAFQPPIDFAALIALDVAVPGQMGMYLRDGEETLSSVLDRIAQSAGAWWGMTATGTFTMGQWAWATPTKTLTEGRQIVTPIKSERVEAPTKLLNLRYAHRIRPMNETDLGDVAIVLDPTNNAEERAKVQQEWLVSRKDGSGEAANRLLARELTVDTLFAESATSVWGPYKTLYIKMLANPRWRLTVDVRGPDGLACTIGKTVRIVTSRFGFNNGDFLVTGRRVQYALDPEEDITTLRLWGPKAAGE
jgi:hypothetical protein